jgi:hypothetical protein
MFIRRGEALQRWQHETHLVPDDRLLDRSEVLEGGQQDVAPLRAADILDKVAKLLAQRNQDLILVLDRLCTAVREGG